MLLYHLLYVSRLRVIVNDVLIDKIVVSRQPIVFFGNSAQRNLYRKEAITVNSLLHWNVLFSEGGKIAYMPPSDNYARLVYALGRIMSKSW